MRGQVKEQVIGNSQECTRGCYYQEEVCEKTVMWSLANCPSSHRSTPLMQ